MKVQNFSVSSLLRFYVFYFHFLTKRTGLFLLFEGFATKYFFLLHPVYIISYSWKGHQIRSLKHLKQLSPRLNLCQTPTAARLYYFTITINFISQIYLPENYLLFTFGSLNARGTMIGNPTANFDLKLGRDRAAVPANSTIVACYQN